MKNHKRMISIIIALAIVICMNTPAYALSKKTDVYEKITYHKAEDLEKVASNYGLMLKTKEKFVKGVTKEVYVYEKYNKDGTVTESRLMTNSEVAELNKSNVLRDDESKGKLEITLFVIDDGNSKYKFIGRGHWTGENLVTKDSPAAGDDFLGLTWGGDGNAFKTDTIISEGKYVNGNNMSMSRSKSDSYRGYVWQFQEDTATSYMDYAHGEIHVIPVGQIDNEETNAKLTYIHTYEDVVGTITIGASIEGVAPAITLSSVSKQWQIEVDIPGLNY